MSERRDNGSAIEARGLVKWYGDPLPLWLCWVVVLGSAAAGMWMAHSLFRKSIK